MNIDKSSSTPSYQQVAEALKAQILDGTYHPGSRLPAESELVRATRLSRITVRKGVELLETEGLVIRKQGLGTFVKSAITQDLTNLQTITEVLVAQGVVPRVKVLRFAPVAPPAAVRKALGAPDGKELLLIERLFLDGEAPIARLMSYLPLSFRRHAEPLRHDGVQTDTLYAIWEKAIGVRLSGATYTVRAARGDRRDARYLGVKLGDPVLALDRLTLDARGKPLEFSVFHYHFERCAFSVAAPRATLRTP